jgi:formylglycine-generating enzyme required for sulfatase activity
MRLTPVVVAIAPLVLVLACSGTAGPAASVDTPGTSSPATSPSPTTASAAAPTETPSLGDTRTDAAGITQVWVPAGSFRMGTSAAAVADLEASGPPAWVASEFPSEQPDHDVTISTGFWIDRDEVTNTAFSAFVDAGGYDNEALWSEDGWAWVSARDTRGLPKRCPDDAPDVPRRCITWYEAEAYATWRDGTLPTEAQWEFAARGPDASVYPWGDEWDPTNANVVDAVGAVAVGGFPSGASWVGANDMAGNAMEWVSDWLAPYDASAGPVTDPTGPSAGEKKVEKGGWWGSNPFVARGAYRHYEDPPTYGDKHIGFRVVSP